MSKTLLLANALALLLVSIPAQAAETPWRSADNARARLFNGQNIQKGFEAALEIELAPGWHSYWKASGDSGLPPRFNWDASENVEKVDIAFPYPKRFDEMGIVTFGYEGAVAFPLTVTLKDMAKPAKLDLSLDLMVCSDICIPETIKLALDVGAGEAGALQGLIDMRKRIVPGESIPSTLSIDAIVAGPDALAVTAYSLKGFEDADLFPLLGDTALTGKPEIMIDPKDPKRAVIKIPKSEDPTSLPDLVAGKTVSVTLVAGDRAVEKSVKF